MKRIIVNYKNAVIISVLFHGIECMPLKSQKLSSFSHAYNSVFSKLFKTKSNPVIEQCQYHCGFWPFIVTHDFRRFSFLLAKFKAGLIQENSFFSNLEFREFCNIADKYGFTFNDSCSRLKFKVWSFLESSLKS